MTNVSKGLIVAAVVGIGVMVYYYQQPVRVQSGFRERPGGLIERVEVQTYADGTSDVINTGEVTNARIAPIRMARP